MRNIIVAPATVTSPTSKATPTRPKYTSVEEYLEKNREGYSRDDAESVSSNDSGFSGSSNKSTNTAPVSTYKDFLNSYGTKKFKSVTPPAISTTDSISNDNTLIHNKNNIKGEIKKGTGLICNDNNKICINVNNEEFSKKNVRSEIYIEIQDNKVQRVNLTQKPKSTIIPNKISSIKNIIINSPASFRQPSTVSAEIPKELPKMMNTLVVTQNQAQSIPPPPPPPMPQQIKNLPPKINRPRLSTPEINITSTRMQPKSSPISDAKISLIDEIKQRVRPDSPAFFRTNRSQNIITEQRSQNFKEQKNQNITEQKSQRFIEQKMSQNIAEEKSQITKDFTRRTLPRNWGQKKKEDLNKNDPEVKKLVYGAYRDMLGAYNNKANNFISTLPRNMVAKDKGVAQQVDNITSQGCIGKLNGRINPKENENE